LWKNTEADQREDGQHQRGPAGLQAHQQQQRRHDFHHHRNGGTQCGEGQAHGGDVPRGAFKTTYFPYAGGQEKGHHKQAGEQRERGLVERSWNGFRSG
jgi:hypothetical protein